MRGHHAADNKQEHRITKPKPPHPNPLPQGGEGTASRLQPQFSVMIWALPNRPPYNDSRKALTCITASERTCQ